jgi:gluconolactonase
MNLDVPLSIDQLVTFADGLDHPESAWLDHPEGICETLDGTMYVGGEAGQLYRIDRDGGAIELLRTDGFLLGLAADAAGRIYAADVGHRCVWRIDPSSGEREQFTQGSPERPVQVPNFGAFGPDGTYYLSDSGTLGEANGCLWRVPPGRPAEVWSEESRCFPNGVAVDREGTRLYVLESFPGALVALEIRADGSAGPREVLCELDSAVPDGLALAVDGSIFIACYRPDAVYRWSTTDGLQTIAEDPTGTVLAAPTNILFTGPSRDEIVVPNIGRWHLTRMPAGVSGEVLHYPSPDQLRG